MNKKELEKYLLEGMTTRQIASVLGCGKSTVQYNVNKFNLKHLYKYSKPKYKDINYFKNINTKEKAYILGFLLGDGYFPKDAKNINIGLTICLKDRCVIDFMKDEIGMNIREQERKDGYPMVEFTVGQRNIVNDLLSLFKFRLKTERIVPKINKNLNRYFILGFFDAEGWASSGIRSNGRYYRNIGMASSSNIINKINLILCQNDITLFLEKPKDKNCSIIRTANKENIIKFINFIYPDDSFVILKRKYDLLIDILKTY